MTLRLQSYVKVLAAPDGRQTSPVRARIATSLRQGPASRPPGTSTAGALASINPFIIFIFRVHTQNGWHCMIIRTRLLAEWLVNLTAK